MSAEPAGRGEPVGVAASAQRWGQVLDHLAGAVADGGTVVVDGLDRRSALVADRLAAALHALGRPCHRLTDATPLADEDRWHAERTAAGVAVADGPRWRAHPPAGGWGMVVWVRTPAGEQDGYRGGDADVVIDLHDPDWPVIRHMAGRLVDRDLWYLSESRAFFAIRAATWDSRFGDELDAYSAAVAEGGLPAGGVVADIGCGTGRAFPALRAAVGPAGTVLGLDLTPQMLAQARANGRGGYATLVLADARDLPLAGGCLDGVFAAGLLNHLPEPEAGLRELARVTRPGGRLVLFHPSGRAALAARHGRALRPDEPLAEPVLRTSMEHAGWRLDRYDDPPHRFLAVATRRQPGRPPRPPDALGETTA